MAVQPNNSNANGQSGELPPAILMDSEIRSIEGVIGAFGKRGVPVIALSALSERPPAFRSRYVQRGYSSPNLQDEKAYLVFLSELPHRGVLLYSSDAGAEFAAKYQARLRGMGYLLNVPDLATFRKGFNKECIFKVCAECGVPTMATREVHQREDIERAAEHMGLPLIVKPTRLAGGKYRVIERREDIPRVYAEMNALVREEAFAAQASGLIVQEFIEHDYDDIFCCESYYGTRGDQSGFLSIQKIRPNINYDGTPGSRLFAGRTVESKDLVDGSRRLLDHLGWKGFAHLDWLYSRKHRQFMLCEINPRLPGFSNFLTAIGFDMAWYYYADLTGAPTEPYRFQPALYFEALRHPGDLTTNLLAAKSGYISWGSYLKSYLEMLRPDTRVVLDVFYGSDLRLTWENYKISLRNLAKKARKW